MHFSLNRMLKGGRNNEPGVTAGLIKIIYFAYWPSSTGLQEGGLTMAKEYCACCGIPIYDDYEYECPVCGNIVCSICFDGEMCDDCRKALNEDKED